MSFDEANLGFEVDAPNTINTPFYLSTDNPIYGFSAIGSSPAMGIWGDIDTYAVATTPGHFYGLLSGSAAYVDWLGESVPYAWSRLLDAAGNVIAASEPIFEDADGLYFQATDDLYFFQIYAPTSGLYALFLSDFDTSEALLPPQELLPGDLVQSSIEHVSDLDSYAFFATAGYTYTFTTWSDNPDSDIFLRIEDTNFEDVAYQNIFDPGSFVFVAPTTGYYYLDAQMSFLWETGNYEFWFNESDTPEVDLDLRSPSPINLDLASEAKHDPVFYGRLMAQSVDEVSYRVVGGSSVGESTVAQGLYGTLEVESANGSFTYTVDNQSLAAAGLPVSDVFVVSAASGAEYDMDVLVIADFGENVFTISDVNDDGSLWDCELVPVSGEPISAVDAQLYRAYTGLLGRDPDAQGLAWWSEQIAMGNHTLESAVGAFLWSDEFIGAFKETANPNDIAATDLILHMYENVFGRAPDPDGFDWWVDQLESEARDVTQAVVDMIQSNEFVSLTAAATVDYFLVG